MRTRIDSFEIRNFKRFGPAGVRIGMAPVTLLFGGNSTGKSSVIQALLLLAQSWAHASQNIMWLAPNGPHVQLGSYYNFRHRSSAPEQDPGPVCFGFVMSDGMKIELHYSASRYEAAEQDEQGIARTEMGFLSRVVFVHPEGERVVLEHEYLTSEITWEDVHLSARGESLTELMGMDPTGAMDMFSNRDFRGLELGITFGDETVEAGRIRFTEPVTFQPWDREDEEEDQEIVELGLPVMIMENEIDAKYQETVARARERMKRLVERLLELRNLLISDFHYIGPQREQGRYVYDLSETSEGTRLAATINNRPEVRDRCNAMLAALEVPYAVHAREMTTTMGVKLVEVFLEDLRPGPSHGVTKGLPNVGFGVTQLLYIVMALAEFGSEVDDDEGLSIPWYSGAWSYLLVEQPELHLHPRWQANLASLFCGTAMPQRPDDDTEFNRCNLILETHSEHLMLRLQRLVRESIIHPNEIVVNVLEAHPGTGTTRITPLRLEADGEPDDIWPGGFFTERDEEILG